MSFAVRFGKQKSDPMFGFSEGIPTALEFNALPGFFLLSEKRIDAARCYICMYRHRRRNCPLAHCRKCFQYGHSDRFCKTKSEFGTESTDQSRPANDFGTVAFGNSRAAQLLFAEGNMHAEIRTKKLKSKKSLVREDYGTVGIWVRDERKRVSAMRHHPLWISFHMHVLIFARKSRGPILSRACSTVGLSDGHTRTKDCRDRSYPNKWGCFVSLQKMRQTGQLDATSDEVRWRSNDGIYSLSLLWIQGKDWVS